MSASYGCLGLPHEIDTVADRFARLDKVIRDEEILKERLGHWLRAVEMDLQLREKYFNKITSRDELERRLQRSLEPGGRLWTRLCEAGWVPPTPAATPPNGANGKGEHVRH